MFSDILVPISSENISEDVLIRAIHLAELFQSKLTFLYIIEEKTLYQTDKLSEEYLSSHMRVQTKKDILWGQNQTANTIVFDDVKKLLFTKNIIWDEKIVQGEFSTIIQNMVQNHPYDLIVMGYQKECLLNYRLLDNFTIPIWIVTKTVGKSMLAVCSNLAPNQKVPEISMNISKILGWDLFMLYVVDTMDEVQVDSDLHRSGKKSAEELMRHGKQFVSRMKQLGIQTNLVTGSLETETVKAAEKLHANLVVVGREQKKTSILAVHPKSTKRKIVDRCEYSLLFIN